MGAPGCAVGRDCRIGVVAEGQAVSIAAEMARNIVETSFERFDESVIEKARHRVIDVIGCAVGGANAPGCAMLLSLLQGWGGKKESTVLGQRVRLPVHNAALMNSVMARSYEFEPSGTFPDGEGAPVHVSGTTVPVALAVAEEHAAAGKDLLTALILGDDLASRLGTASHLNVDSGWDSAGTINVFGAAAVAGKLWGLDEHQICHALGIAINQMSGTFQNTFDYAHTFKLPQGLAAQAGVFAAALARKGFTGARDPLTGRHGYFSLYCRTYRLDILTNRLGSEFLANDTLKPYPCCRSSHAAIECTLALANGSPIAPEEIDEIVVAVTPAAKKFAGQPFRIGEVPQVNAAFSLQYAVASALLRKSVKLEHFTEEYVRDPRIMDIAGKIRLIPSLPPEKLLGTVVRIKTREGKEYEKGIDVPRGMDASQPLTGTEKREKFLANVVFSRTVSPDKAEKALSLLERLEEIDNIAKILRLLVS